MLKDHISKLMKCFLLNLNDRFYCTSRPIQMHEIELLK